MLSAANHRLPRRVSVKSVSAAVILLVCCVSCFSQQGPPKGSAAPLKYDLQTETKANGVVDDVKVLSFGTRKDFIQLILKDGSGTIVLYMCPKPFEDEIGVTFAKGDQISFTGSRVKQEESEVILARDVAKGEMTFTFRDPKR